MKNLVLFLGMILTSSAMGSGINGTFPEIPESLHCEVTLPHYDEPIRFKLDGLQTESKVVMDSQTSDHQVTGGRLTIHDENITINYSQCDQILYIKINRADLKRFVATEVSWFPMIYAQGYEWDDVYVTETQGTCTY